MSQSYEWVWVVGAVIAAYVVIRNLGRILLGLLHLVGALLAFGSVCYVTLGTAQPFEQRLVTGGIALLVGVWLARSGPRRENRGGASTCRVCGGTGWLRCTGTFCPLATYQGGICGRCNGTGSTPCPGCHGLG